MTTAFHNRSKSTTWQYQLPCVCNWQGNSLEIELVAKELSAILLRPAVFGLDGALTLSVCRATFRDIEIVK